MAFFESKESKKKKRQAEIERKVADINRPPNLVRAKSGYTVGSKEDTAQMRKEIRTRGAPSVTTRADIVKDYRRISGLSTVPAKAKAALETAKKKKVKGK